MIILETLALLKVPFQSDQTVFSGWPLQLRTKLFLTFSMGVEVSDFFCKVEEMVSHNWLTLYVCQAWWFVSVPKLKFIGKKPLKSVTLPGSCNVLWNESYLLYYGEKYLAGKKKMWWKYIYHKLYLFLGFL